ncbi:hypothetical protein GH722_19375 [Alphaproteobacteria bacterium HT1-32]|nr:hypothetical protein [Alphaproteobacteria bacterium HT1-32]
MVKLLYAGFDTFDFAVRGAFPLEVLDQLEAGRDEAEERQDKALIRIGANQIKAHIESFGKKGGYRYLLDTGPLGAKWMIKRNTDANQWNIFVSPRATMLLAYGYRETFDRLHQAFIEMGGQATGHSINRVDFAMDFETSGFELHPEQIVAHSHTKVAPYWGKKEGELDPYQPSSVYRGRVAESATIGKQPGRQIIIYNKRREAIERQKWFWFEAWSKDPHDQTLEVWRIEVRAGKKELKDKYRITSIEDFEASIGDVIVNALDGIRYLDDFQGDSNVTRQTLSPLWQAAQETAASNLLDLRSGLTPGQVKEVERTQAQETYLALCAGNAVGLAICRGLSDEQIATLLPMILAKEIGRYFRPKSKDLHAIIKRARDRIVFLE